MASAAVGRNAAFPKAIGITAMAISTSPFSQSAEQARSKQPREKLQSPIPRPKRRLRFATQLPTGHCKSTSHPSSRAITKPLQASFKAGRCKPPRTRSRGKALCSKATMPVATMLTTSTGTRGNNQRNPLAPPEALGLSMPWLSMSAWRPSGRGRKASTTSMVTTATASTTYTARMTPTAASKAPPRAPRATPQASAVRANA